MARSENTSTLNDMRLATRQPATPVHPRSRPPSDGARSCVTFTPSACSATAREIMGFGTSVGMSAARAVRFSASSTPSTSASTSNTP